MTLQRLGTTLTALVYDSATIGNEIDEICKRCCNSRDQLENDTDGTNIDSVNIGIRATTK